MTTVEVLRNPSPGRAPALAGDGGAALAFQRTLPGYAPTRLVDARGLAALLGVECLWVKDETSRFGLPAFKVLGASWGAACALAERCAAPPPRGLDEARELAARAGPALCLTTATDGNHGRAVARVARWLGAGAEVLVPHGTVAARIDAIAGEGAQVEVVAGSYDDAVELAAARCARDPKHLLVQDTAFDGYRSVPAAIMQGYRTIAHEVDAALAGQPAPTCVVLQVGVGSFAAALAAHWCGADAVDPPRIVCVEPLSAACALASARAGRAVRVPGPHTSVMAGLNSGVVSALAWPVLRAVTSAFVAVGDELAGEAVRVLAAAGIEAGATGAAGLAGLLGAARAGALDALGLDRGSRVLLFVTDGVTDPVAHRAFVAGRGEPRCDDGGGPATLRSC